ncbi:hypothetical protein TNCV_581361 [Trichonephila clavipes]|nr:hypothetical protein TNCV_581361 [Trichonephila clavipes]
MQKIDSGHRYDVKDPWNLCLALVLSAKIKPSADLHRQGSGAGDHFLVVLLSLYRVLKPFIFERPSKVRFFEALIKSVFRHIAKTK